LYVNCFKLSTHFDQFFHKIKKPQEVNLKYFLFFISVKDITIPVDPSDLTIHSMTPSGGRVHFGNSDKGEDMVSLYGTPKEEIPPLTSSGMRSDNGATAFNFNTTTGSQVKCSY